MAVVCDTCKTENRDHAMFCRGCAAKLPAFAATGPSALAALNASAAGSATERRRSTSIPATGHPGRLWVGLAGSLVLMAIVFAGWYAYVVRPSAQPAARLAAAAAPPPMAATRALPLTLLTPVEPVVTVESAAPAQPPQDLQQTQPAQALQPMPQRMAPPIPVPSRPVRVSSAASRGGDPRSVCSHLNFIAAARCEAAQCSTAAYSRHPRCDAVREQGRRDEARRNPLMAN